MTAPLSIDVVSDVVCPWCFLGKRRLEAAVRAVDIPVEIHWRPFQLDPSIPPEGVDRDDYIRTKFGDLDALDAAHERLAKMGRAVGANYRFDLIRRNPNTIDAHRVVRWATAKGHESAIVERLFADYFTNGLDVGDHGILADAAASVGLDREATLLRLAGPDDRNAILAEIADAQRMGVTGVPCFIFGNKYGVMGAQAEETLIRAIRQASAHLAETPA
jgi:predicted DsbA family dithiol-disulfide isomerase